MKRFAALLVLLAASAFAIGDEIPAARTVETTRANSKHVLGAAGSISATSGAPVALFGIKENDVMFSFQKPDRTYPTIVLLDKGRIQANAAAKINQGLKEETDRASAAERANVHLDAEGKTLLFAFEGIRFKKQSDGTLKVWMVSGPVQFEFPQTVRLSDLASGVQIPLSGEATRERTIATAKMKLKITIYFDDKTGQLQIREANGSVKVIPAVGFTLNDPDELPEVIYGTKAKVVPKPNVILTELEEA